MEKAEYMRLKAQLNFDRPLWVTFAVLATDLALFILAVRLAMTSHWPIFVLSQALLAVIYFHHFAILHEAGHGNLYKQRWVNTLIGHYASLFCFLPYFSWKYIHHEHHTWVGNVDRDPTMKNLKKYQEIGNVPPYADVVWRGWIPIPAFMQHFVLWFYPIRLWGYGPSAKEKFYRSLGSVLWLAGCYAVAFTLLPTVFTWSHFWLSLIFYLLLVEIINFPHHLKMPVMTEQTPTKVLPPWKQYLATRSCNYPYGLSELLCLNFNLHTEHHFFPNLPWFRLKTVRKHIKPTLGENYRELQGIGWNIENRKKPAREIFASRELME